MNHRVKERTADDAPSIPYSSAAWELPDIAKQVNGDRTVDTQSETGEECDTYNQDSAQVENWYKSPTS